MKTETYIDRSNWGAGPGVWDTEPDKAEWTDEETGLDCLAVRTRLGHWCGYVGVPEGHPFYERDYYSLDTDVDVHGDLTYSNSCSGNICHESDKKVWWLGFDCAHSGDLSPGHSREFHVAVSHLFRADIYRTLEYVKNECASLASQLREAA